MKSTDLINCTPHALRLYAADGKTIIAELPSTTVVRVKTTPQFEVERTEDGIPIVTSQKFAQECTGLPHCEEDAIPPIVWAHSAPRKWLATGTLAASTRRTRDPNQSCATNAATSSA